MYQSSGPREMSARRKGVRQGAALFLAGTVMVPVLGILNAFIHGPNMLDILVPMAAVIFFLGGLMRMLFAGLFEEGAPRLHHIMPTAYAPFPVSQLGASAPAGLPPAQHHPAPAWRPHPNTAEVRQPSSVTENTTRLLDKDEPRNR
jgi:hypothetical protein